MAGEIPNLEAAVRTGTGKGAARQARRDNLVPGVVYGGGKDPLPVSIPFNVLLVRLKAGRFLATLFNLKVDGHDDVRVICRAVQRDVVKDLPTHFDFMRLHRTTKINLFIPVEVIGEEESVGLKRGGALTMVRPEIDLIVTAGDIPDHVTIDISALDIGDSITISDVTLPEGAKPTIDRDFVIASIQPPSGLTAAEEEGDEDDVAADEVPTTDDEGEGEESED